MKRTHNRYIEKDVWLNMKTRACIDLLEVAFLIFLICEWELIDNDCMHVAIIIDAGKGCYILIGSGDFSHSDSYICTISCALLQRYN